MTDIGQSTEELELKIAQEEHSILQKETALKGLELNEKKMKFQLKQNEQSKTDILAQVEEHKENIKALQIALNKE